MKHISITIVLLLLVLGCANRSSEIQKFENLYEFEELPKPCNSDRNCKLIDRRYVECNGRDVFVYSNLVLKGKNEERALEISKNKVDAEKEKIKLEECILVIPKPPRGICWKRQCEIIYTHRS